MPLFRDKEMLKKFVAGLITGMIIFGALTFFAIITMAVSPTIAYATPADGATFVDVWRGHGVNITVNVSDADGDLQQVVLKWNNSGTWATFYDSGALGGVSYHNVTVLNTNFTGSWTTYEWKICAKDGTGWVNTTYSFTTEYVWGDINCIVLNDLKNYYTPFIYKNDTGEYHLVFVNNNDADVEHKISTNGLDWITKSITDIDTDTLVADGGRSSRTNTLFTYNGKLYVYYQDVSTVNSNYGMWAYSLWNGTAWSARTYIDDNINGYYISESYETDLNGQMQTNGMAVKYYDGEWHRVYGRASTASGAPYLYLSWVHSASPLTNIAPSVNFETIQDPGSGITHDFYPSLEILDGYLVLTYKDSGNDLHWKVYDGVTWVDKGDIELDIGEGCSMIKDPVNDQLIVVYENGAGKLVYRVLDDVSGSWSANYTIFTPANGKNIRDPFVSYIDRRIVVVFSYDLRGTYNIYMISAPEYLSSAGGVLKQYNRIQFPDATPNQKNVNSSVFYFENINSRAINWINWSFSDIGSIQCENNIRLWGSTDNSSWTLIGTTDANGYINMTTTTWAGGLPWQAGEKRYFKLEILDVGNVPEDLHSVDEGIILKVGLA